MKKIKYAFLTTALAMGFLVVGVLARAPHTVHAADNDFSNGITVDSTGDGADNNIGDGICDDGSGNCTLRAAIEESNENSGADVIEFNIAGSGVQTISPASSLPTITEQLSILGDTQPGATCGDANISRSLLIELNGSLAGASNGLHFDGSSNTNVIRGMVINGFTGVAIDDQSTGNSIFSCNYIGTNALGTDDQENTDGISIGSGSNNSRVGGTANTAPGGHCRGDCNLLSGNVSSDLMVFADDVSILGNYICTNYAGTGKVNSPNRQGNPAVYFETGSDNNSIGNGAPAGRNIISGCTHTVGSDASEGLQINGNNNSVKGNYFGVDTTGLLPLGSDGSGIVITTNGSSAINNIVGGTTPSERNIISSNGSFIGAPNLTLLSLSAHQVSENIVTGNYIGTDKNGNVNNAFQRSPGVGSIGNASNNMIGGTVAGSANLIAGNSIGIFVFGISAFGFLPNANTYFGNIVYDNSTLPIDISDDTNGDFAPETGAGVDVLDAGDSDTGPQNFINWPTITATLPATNSTSITYDLDINDSEASVTGYRVDFYANEAVHASGHGEGRYHIGHDIISGDVNGRTYVADTSSLPSGTYHISSTVTEIDGSSDGFGNTSEFGSVLSASIVSNGSGSAPNAGNSSNQGGLVNTGQDSTLLSALSLLVLITGILIMFIKKRRQTAYR